MQRQTLLPSREIQNNPAMSNVTFCSNTRRVYDVCSFQDKDLKVSRNTCPVLAPYFILFDYKCLPEMQVNAYMFEY